MKIKTLLLAITVAASTSAFAQTISVPGGGVISTGTGGSVGGVVPPGGVVTPPISPPVVGGGQLGCGGPCTLVPPAPPVVKTDLPDVHSSNPFAGHHEFEQRNHGVQIQGLGVKR